MEGAFEGDNPELFRVALGIMITTRGLDCTFQCFRAGVGEEDLVCERFLRQALGKLFLARNFIEVRDMPDLFGLRLDRVDKMWVGMAQRIDGNAGRKIEISLAAFGVQPDALASLEAEGALANVSNNGAAASAMAVSLLARMRCQTVVNRLRGLSLA